MDLLRTVLIFMYIIENGYNIDGKIMGDLKHIPVTNKIIVRFNDEAPYVERINMSQLYADSYSGIDYD